MNKRKLHHYWRYVRDIKPWHLIVLFILLAGASVWALRNNSQNLEPLVAAVVTADKKNKNIEEALESLHDYMSSHMNADIDEPVQLAYSYDRAAKKILEKAQATADGDIYKKAQSECEDPNVLLSVRAACIQDYVTRNARPGQEPEALDFPDKAIYTYSFISPKWSPDLAGWLVVASGIVLLVLISRIIAGALVKRTLKNHS